MKTTRGAMLLVLLIGASVVAGGVGSVAADHRNDPRFETDVAEPVLQPGATQELTVELTNDATAYDERVERALDVSATVEPTAGIDVLSGSRDLGQMGDGDTRAVSVRIEVPRDIPAGTHEIPVTVAYRDVDDEDERVTTTVTATVRVQERARFAVTSVESTAPIGDSGTVSVTVENVGERTATDAVVGFRSANADLTFGRSATAERFAGDVAPGETRTVEVDAAVAERAERREYAISATVDYETPDGKPATSRRLSFGVVPLPEQTFEAGDFESTLRVGEEGELRGTVTNTGESTVRNAVVRFETANPNVSPLESEVAVGTLEPGESVDFAFDVEISDAATAGDRQFTLRVQYRDDEGTQRTSDPLDAPATVAESRDEFTVRAVDSDVPAGETGVLTLEVTNERETAVEDVSAKLFLDAPLSSSDDEGFIAELAPGETARVTFDLSVADSALVDKAYPAKVDFQYETADGRTLISDTYRVPITATESSGGGLPFGLGTVGAGVVGIGVLGVGSVLYARRG